MKEMNMERVALDPLAAVEEAAEVGDPGRRLDVERRLERPAGRHLIGDRTDPADPGDEVGHLVDGTTDEELLEKPGWLVDVELDDLDALLIDAEAQRALPLNPGQRFHGERPRFAHGLASSAPGAAASRSASARNGGAQALIPWTSRWRSSRGTPAAS